MCACTVLAILSQAIQLLLGHSDIIVLTELPKPDKEDPKPNPGTE